MLQSCCGKNACGSHALVVELEGGAPRDIRGNASCWPARRQVHLLSHLPGSGSAAVRQCFVCSFQVTPGSSGRLRSDPGNEGISLALFALAVNPQRQQATSPACLQGLRFTSSSTIDLSFEDMEQKEIPSPPKNSTSPNLAPSHTLAGSVTQGCCEGAYFLNREQ